METIKRLTWKVVPACTPLYKKRCGKCKNSDYYYCSDKFRMNSQKRSIDVCLIYKCRHCDNTCNITILSRTRPELIDKELFQKFSMNDTETAWKYAFDMDTIRKNKMEVDYDSIEYNINCEKLSLSDIAGMDEDILEFEIDTGYNLELRLTALIRKYFNISSGRLSKLTEMGIICLNTQTPIKKIKVKNGIIVSVNKGKLSDYLNNANPNY